MQVDENYETKTYLHPIDGNSEKEMKAIIKHLTHQTNPYFTEQTVEPIQGRQLTIPKACNLVCIYNFNELMENTMGDSDFRAICKAFKAVIIRNMRKIGRE
jgi:predicted ATPase